MDKTTVTQTPLISIGIPCYNRVNELRRLLEQVLSQTYKNIEVLISNNCSSDPEVDKLCCAIAKIDSRIRYFKQITNIGASKNHNFLLRNATAAYFIFLGDDDEINSEYVEYLVSAVLHNDRIALAGGQGIRFLEGNFWYNYNSYSNYEESCYCRLASLIPLVFDKHWVFEQYWAGLFRVQMHPSEISLDFKSTLFRIFWVSEQGSIVYEPNAIYKKNTSNKELENHAKGHAYRRHILLKLFRDDHLHSVQQCLPVSIQISAILLKSRNLNSAEKIQLLFLLWISFVRICIPCEFEGLKGKALEFRLSNNQRIKRNYRKITGLLSSIAKRAV
jgi:glycosyltransferase involved in cell wall biosynthesis